MLGHRQELALGHWLRMKWKKIKGGDVTSFEEIR
jgi:hypothetical protein